MCDDSDWEMFNFTTLPSTRISMPDPSTLQSYHKDPVAPRTQQCIHGWWKRSTKVLFAHLGGSSNIHAAGILSVEAT